MRPAPTSEGAPFGVVVPIRAFRLGNTRLAEVLDEDAREALARRLAHQVVCAAEDAPVVVVTSAPDVVEWAHGLALGVVPDPGSLDGAARAGCAALRAQGCRRVVVAHADLPFAVDFAAVVRDAGLPIAVIVPCHHDDGTPVLSLPAGTGFAFAYGPGSFRRHAHHARSVGLGVRIVREAALAFDVDTAADVARLAACDPGFVGLRAAGASCP